MATEIRTTLAITYWQGTQRFCEGCSHYHDIVEPCRCPDCGTFAPCRTHGYST